MATIERAYYEQAELWEKDFQSIPVEEERISRTISLIPADVRTILDVGCGNGAFLNSLSDVYETVGLDASSEALKHVHSKSVHGDISELPFDPESFDLLTCLEVLEHLPLDVFKKALSEIQRVAKKYILISVPNSEDLDYHLVICPECRCWYNPNRHVRSFNSQKLESLFGRFVLSELHEIGPLEPRPQYNRLLYTAYRLRRGVLPPSTAICPQCGYQSSRSPASVSSQRSVSLGRSGGLFLGVTRLLKPIAKLIWRPQKRRRWLLALYMRTGKQG